MRRLSAISLYGPKPSNLERLVLGCQQLLSGILNENFAACQLPQIHGTIISLSAVYDALDPKSGQNESNRHLSSADILGYLRRIETEGDFPIAIRVGGFRADEHPFLSRGQPPYVRSFSFQNGKAILIGWPTTRGYSSEVRLTPALARLRSMGEEFNIKHAYNEPGLIDNEYYFRIGLVRDALSDESSRAAERVLRDYISNDGPTVFDIKMSDVSVVSYIDATLPVNSTRVLPISDVRTTDDVIGLLR